MKFKFLALIFSASLSGLLQTAAEPPIVPAAAPAAAAIGTNAAPGPKIEFATTSYDFGRIKAGDPVKFTYVFTNTGVQTLEVSHVQPSCGCTAAGEWTRKVEPGQTGAIPMQFNSANFNGPVSKTITVNSNDRQKPSVILQLKGTIWKPIELSPAYAVLMIPPDAQSVSITNRVINNTEELLTLESAECNQPSFSTELITVTPGKEFQVVISSKPPIATASLQGKIAIKTSSTNHPSLDLPLYVHVQPAVTIIPQQLTLPAGPLSGKGPISITIQNNSTNQLTVSEPQINLPQVEIELKEMNPGRTFAALLKFPEGFEVTPGQQLAFTAKTSNPKVPTIRVPIYPSPRMAAAPPSSPAKLPVQPPPQPVRAPNVAAPAKSAAPANATPPPLPTGPQASH